MGVPGTRAGNDEWFLLADPLSLLRLSHSSPGAPASGRHRQCTGMEHRGRGYRGPSRHASWTSRRFSATADRADRMRSPPPVVAEATIGSDRGRKDAGVPSKASGANNGINVVKTHFAPAQGRHVCVRTVVIHEDATSPLHLEHPPGRAARAGAAIRRDSSYHDSIGPRP
jgi:hypothetical protein